MNATSETHVDQCGEDGIDMAKPGQPHPRTVDNQRAHKISEDNLLCRAGDSQQAYELG
jgi:hypothetical protein